jgi:uncharacterized membrane protein YjfL (UPF0719 family)
MNLSKDLLPLLERVGWDLPLFLVAFACLWFTKVLYQRTEKFDFAYELTESDNPAFGTAIAGYLLGATIALGAAFPKETPSDLPTLVNMATLLAEQGLLVAFLMRASVWMIGHAVIYRFGLNDEMVRDRNAGAGAVVAGGCIAAGLVLNGALSGESDSLWMALRDVLVFWALGQVILVIGAHLHGKAARYDVQKALGENNTAAGFSLGGFLAAIGIIINAALHGASSDLPKEILITVTVSALGIVFLLCGAIIAAKVFLPHAHMPKEIETDRNMAVGVLSAACSIAVGLLLARVVAQ